MLSVMSNATVEQSTALPAFDDLLIRASLEVDHHLNQGRPITPEEMDHDIAQYREEWRQHKAARAGTPFVPSSLQVDRVWHAHMCVPQQYGPDCNEYFGHLIEHSAPKCVDILIK